MKTMHKWFWAWEFEEEEQWLAALAEQGLALKAVGFCRYDFEECTPGEYAVRLQRLAKPVRKPESQEYITFVEETGAEYIGTVNQWVYFRKRTEEGPFELFSDAASRIRQLDGLLCFLLPLAVLNLFIGLQNLVMYHTVGFSANLVGILNLALCGLIGCGAARLWNRRKRLKQENELFEN